jgi:hypothetical protein
MIEVNTQSDQVLPSPFRFLPVMPYSISQTITNPTVKVSEFAVNTCHSEVVHPSPLYLFQLADSFIERVRNCFPGDGFQF